MKIPIPKEAIGKIVTDYHCSEEEAAKAYLDGQDQANDAFKSFLDKRLGTQESSKNDLIRIMQETEDSIFNKKK